MVLPGNGSFIIARAMAIVAAALAEFLDPVYKCTKTAKQHQRFSVESFECFSLLIS